MEDAPGSKKIEAFNKALAQKNERLPPVTDHSIRYGSLSCSHTNMYLRCVASAVASDDTDVAEEGKINLAKIKARDPQFADAAVSGLQWTVLSHRVATRFPKLLGMIQAAKNASGQVARRENEVQVLLRLQAAAVSAMTASASPHVDWKSIQAKVVESRPPCADDVPDREQHNCRLQYTAHKLS